MRGIKFFVFVFLFLVFSIFSFADWKLGKKPDCSKGNCGKVIGWIVDSETNEPVKENFFVAFCDCRIKTGFDPFLDDYIQFLIKSDRKGYFSFMLPEGKYCLQFWPESYGSKYSFDPEPVYKNENLQVIKVKRSQITNVKKIAKYGGKLKIILVDTNNNPLNPLEIFHDKINTAVKLTSQKVSPTIFAMPDLSDEQELNDGETVIHRLHPDKYDVYIEFENMGYGTQKIPDVEIERKKTSEIRVTIDKNNQTGIEGWIKDVNNIPLPNIEVSVISYAKLPYIIDGGSTITDSDGYYKIINLKEQKYQLEIYGVVGDTKINKKFDNIIIRNNVLLKKDIVLDF
jgi:predicted transport protein